MNSEQHKKYEFACDKIESLIGFGHGEINGNWFEFEVSKGTWHINGLGYVDDLLMANRLPACLLHKDI